MVSLVDIYNIKESTFSELKKDRDPARGNKGKNREKDFYFIDEPADPETGAVKSKVVYKKSISNMVKDLEAELQDFRELVKDKPEDLVIYNIFEELKEIYNKFRTHVRKNYPEEYERVSRLKEQSSTSQGGFAAAGGSGAQYATPFAFKKKGKKGPSIYYYKLGYKPVPKIVPKSYDIKKLF